MNVSAHDEGLEPIFVHVFQISWPVIKDCCKAPPILLGLFGFVGECMFLTPSTAKGRAKIKNLLWFKRICAKKHTATPASVTLLVQWKVVDQVAT